jgi:hypothetical protein
VQLEFSALEPGEKEEAEALDDTTEAEHGRARDVRLDPLVEKRVERQQNPADQGENKTNVLVLSKK